MTRIDRPAGVGVQAAAASAPPSNANISDKGLLVSNPTGWRNFLRFGGAAAAVAGVAALAIKGASGGGIAAAGSGFVPLAIGGAAIGAVMAGSSFLGGLQPKYKPFAASGITGLENAQAKAVELGDDTAILETGSGKYSLVDYSDRDFDNDNLRDLKLDSQGIRWTGLVSKDGDFIRPAAEGSWDVVGRAHPDPVDLNRLDASQVSELTGEQIGTTDSHAPATFGRVVGNPEGYATPAEASVAAYGASGETAIVKVDGKYLLMEVRLPNGADVEDLAARGTAVSPVNALSLQDEKKIYRAGDPGDDLGFVGRAIPFSTSEPIGQNIAGRSVQSLVTSSANREQLINRLKSDDALSDAVFFGRAGGGAMLRTQDPDGKVGFHLYNLGTNRAGTNWDEQLGDVQATLTRKVDTDRNYEYVAPYGTSSQWAIDQAYVVRTDLSRTRVILDDENGQDFTLRNSGWTQTSRERDWQATINYRDRLEDDLYYATHPNTSPGDTHGGNTSPGDTHGGATSGGDTGGVVVPPANGGNTGGGDTPAPTPPPIPTPTPTPVPTPTPTPVPTPTPTPTTPANPNSTDNGNPSDGDF